MAIKVMHIDDDADSLYLVKHILVNNFTSDLNLIGSYQSAHEGIEQVREHMPDILLLDIEMGEMNGFEVAKRITDIPTKVFFLSGQVSNVIDAMDMSELPYLLKPIRPIDFQHMIVRYNHLQFSNARLKQQVENAQQHISAPKENMLTSLCINSSSKIEIIPFHQVCYLKSDGPSTVIITIDGNKFSSSKSLLFYEKLLSSRDEFIRCHRSSIVNTNHIVHLKKTKYSFQVLMANDDSLDVSFLKKKEVYDYLLKRKRPGDL